MAAPQEQSNRPKRNRIIINLERVRTAAHIPHLPGRGSRGAKILALLGVGFVVIVLAVLAGAFLWWQNYKTRPAYSLALLVDAVQNNDQETFNRIVDTDKVVESFVPQVTEKAIGRYASALTAPLRKQIEALVPKLVPGVKEQVRAEVTKKIKELSERAEGKPFILVALGMPYMVDIREEGDTARVLANLNNRPVELTMTRNGDLWKIVGVKDDAMASQIVDRIAKSLPALTPDVEKEVRKNLPKDVEKNIPKNMNVEDIKKNIPNIPGITDGGNSNANNQGNNENDNQ
jgi:hypothetical protein